MKSKLWDKIIMNPSFKGYCIVPPSKREAANKRVWCALWVFFDYKITDVTINKYHKEGRQMAKGEMLDRHKLPIECYGKALVFS